MEAHFLRFSCWEWWGGERHFWAILSHLSERLIGAARVSSLCRGGLATSITRAQNYQPASQNPIKMAVYVISQSNCAHVAIWCWSFFLADCFIKSLVQEATLEAQKNTQKNTKVVYYSSLEGLYAACTFF